MNIIMPPDFGHHFVKGMRVGALLSWLLKLASRNLDRRLDQILQIPSS